MYANLEKFLLLSTVRLILYDSFEDLCKLGSKEDGDNCRRCFVSTESVVVTCRSY